MKAEADVKGEADMGEAQNPGGSFSLMLVVPLAALVLLVVVLLIWPDLLIGASLGDFLIVTVLLGGGTAWLTGKAVARGWGPYSHLVLYSLLLAGAVRFCHFALFGDTLASLEPALVEFVLLLAIATLGFRALRRRQMTHQYDWMFEPAGPLAWRARTGGPR